MEEEIIFCSRCGEPMKKGQRNCLKCGQLNYENPINGRMRKYETAAREQQNPYVIGQGMATKATNHGLAVREMLADKAGNLTLCAILNILFYIGGVVLIFLVAFVHQNDLASILFNQRFLIVLIAYSFAFIEIYALQLLLMRANKAWWKALIPVYNLYVLYDITMDHGWLFLLTFVPIVGIVSTLVLLYRLGKVYGKNPWLTLLFSFIMIPVIGFDSTTNYKNILYVSVVKGKASIGALYKWNKRVSTLALGLVLLGIIAISYHHREWFICKFNQIKTFSFLRDAKLIVEDAKKSIQEDDYTCSNYLPIDQQEIYYIAFNNAGAYFDSERVTDSPLSIAYYRGYIKVVHSNGGDTKYYIALDDNIYGILETEESEIKNIYAKKNTYSKVPEGAVICSKIKS